MTKAQRDALDRTLRNKLYAGSTTKAGTGRTDEIVLRITEPIPSRFSPAHPLYRAGWERIAFYHRLHAEEEAVRDAATQALRDKLFGVNPYGPK